MYVKNPEYFLTVARERSISKAAGSLSISPTSMTLDATTKSKTITVTRSGDGTISADVTGVVTCALAMCLAVS